MFQVVGINRYRVVLASTSAMFFVLLLMELGIAGREAGFGYMNCILTSLRGRDRI